MMQPSRHIVPEPVAVEGSHMNLDPRVAGALKAAIEQLRDLSPEITDILDKAKAGEITETVAMANLMEAVGSNPEASKKFQALMMNALAPLRDRDTAFDIPAVGHFRDDTIAPRHKAMMPQLNPLTQAALVERAQFDGDMPELRTGPIAPGVMPAVPVATMSRNPIALGAMLGKASDKMRKELTDRANARRAEIERQMFLRAQADFMLTDPHGLGLQGVWGEIERRNPSTHDAATELAGTAETDPVGYRRGELPHPMAVARPTGAMLGKLNFAQSQEMAWRFVSTTQGRRSAIPAVRNMLLGDLATAGVCNVESRQFDPKAPRDQVLAVAEWTVTLAGQNSTQPAFSLIEVAAKTLARRLVDQLKGAIPDKCILEVETVDRIPDREVGWRARLLPKD